ncbi:hypothetical protein FOA52_006958 [Chlamydomonas sp. UWO 241]|nr:hypothetical protein FOA52_006958 [Chlamydomonas sp. UWO 241]
MEGYHALPLVTRTYATLAFVTTAACSLEIFSSHKLYYNTKAIMNGEPWRLATNFLWFGNFGVDFVFHMFFLLRYSKSLEEGSFRGRSADYLWMLLLGSVFMIVAAPFLDVMFLGPSLTFMMVYVWARRNQYVRMSLLGVFTFTAPYLPWVLLALSIVLGNSPYIDLLGIAAGHIYYFLEDVYPRMSQQRRPLRTPSFVRALFPTDEPVVRLVQPLVDPVPPPPEPEDWPAAPGGAAAGQ